MVSVGTADSAGMGSRNIRGSLRCRPILLHHLQCYTTERHLHSLPLESSLDTPAYTLHSRRSYIEHIYSLSTHTSHQARTSHSSTSAFGPIPETHPSLSGKPTNPIAQPVLQSSKSPNLPSSYRATALLIYRQILPNPLDLGFRPLGP